MGSRVLIIVIAIVLVKVLWLPIFLRIKEFLIVVCTVYMVWWSTSKLLPIVSRDFVRGLGGGKTGCSKPLGVGIVLIRKI